MKRFRKTSRVRVSSSVIKNSDRQLETSFESASTLTMGSEWETFSENSKLSDLTPSPAQPKYKHRRHPSTSGGPTFLNFERSLSQRELEENGISNDTTKSPRLGIQKPSYDNGVEDKKFHFSSVFKPSLKFTLPPPKVKSIRDDEEESNSTESSSQDDIERFFHKKTAERDSSHKKRISPRSNSSSSYLGGDQTKIFILLIQPSTKKFELIELMFRTSVGTLGDILQLIPSSSTDESLGRQRHRGLCRPTDGVEMRKKSYFALGASKSRRSYRILQGEILIAIPDGYTAYECKELSKPILKHPGLMRLLKREEPLKPVGLIKTKHSENTSSKSRPRKKNVQFEIDIKSVSSATSISQPVNVIPDIASVASNASQRSFFSAFLQNERYYQEMNHHNIEIDTGSVVSVEQVLDKVTFSATKVLVDTIGTMTSVVSKIVAPEDYKISSQNFTRALVKRRGKKASLVDPVASLKVFAAFISFVIGRIIVSAEVLATPMGAKGAIVCAGFFTMLTQLQKQHTPNSLPRLTSTPERRRNKKGHVAQSWRELESF